MVLSGAVVVPGGVQAPVQRLPGVLEDLAVARLALGVGGDGEGVQPGQAAHTSPATT